MNRTGIPYLDFGWNPGGYGCSNVCNCPTCWAYKMATTPRPSRPVCPDCRTFRVHHHPERLAGNLAPGARKKPAVVGVQFTGDLFDRYRTVEQILAILDTLHAAPQHRCVLLTRQYERAYQVLEKWLNTSPLDPDQPHRPVDRWHIGTTCQTQADYDRAAKYFSDSRWLWWVSGEPLAGPITPAVGHRPPQGIILGADNQPGEPYDIAWHRQTAQAFAAAGVAVFVKQLWMWGCPECGRCREQVVREDRCGCGTPNDEVRHTLVKNPALFPTDLRSRDLPWTLTMEAKA